MGVDRLIRRSLIAISVAGAVGLFSGVVSFASTGPLRVIPSCAGLARSPVAYRAGRIVVHRDWNGPWRWVRFRRGGR